MSDSNIIDFLENFNPSKTTSLITTKADKQVKTNGVDEYKYQAKGLLKANESATFDDFIEMVSKLVCLTMDENKVEFLPDENQHVLINPENKIDKSYITYRLMSRFPEREIKPMAREEVIEPGVNGEDRIGTIYGQRFDCMVQFNIFASNYKVANKVMKDFEDMIFSFTGYMMSKGVQHILFKGQYTDNDFDIYRKSLSVRNLKYEVKIEDLIVVFKDKVESIITEGAL